MKKKIVFIIFTFILIILIYKLNINNRLVINYQHPGYNIILISIDDLRYNSISAFGNKNKTTPNLDKIIKKSLVFNNAYSPSSWTLPVVSSWFSGLLPSKHKVENKICFNKNGTEEYCNLNNLNKNSLAEILKKNGYKTAAFTGGAAVSSNFGLNRGFDIFIDNKDFEGFEYSYPLAINWIKENRDKKFFIFLHGYNIHGQYYPKNGIKNIFLDFKYSGKLNGSKEEQKTLRENIVLNKKNNLNQDDAKYLKSIYDEKIFNTDLILNDFFQEFKKININEKTIFVIISDHGEEFMEHGGIDHGMTLYNELIHVPFFIKFPKNEKQININNSISTIDLFPTILDILKIKSDQKIDGKSVFKRIEKNSFADVYSETKYRYTVYLKSIISENFKLIDNFKNKNTLMFNIKNDPNENLVIKNKITKYFLRQKIKQNE